MTYSFYLRIVTLYRPYLNKMLTHKGNAPLLAILAISAVLVFIIVTSLASFQNKLFKSLYPKKSSYAVQVFPKLYSGPEGASFLLSTGATDYPQDQQIPVVINMRSDTFKANLFSAKISFDPNVLEILSVDSSDTFVTNWVERAYDNSLGTASVIGAVPKPGFNTSGSDAAMAVLFFKAKAPGLFTVSFSPMSVIYRNTDNINILSSTTNATFTVAPTPTPTPTPTPSPTPSSTVSPSPTPPPAECALSSASWISSTNPIDEGNIVRLGLTTSGDCVSKQVAFEIREDDGIFGSDPVRTNPSEIILSSSNSYSTAWVAEYQPDGFNGINDPPEYYFVVSLTDGSSSATSEPPQLQVNKLPPTVYHPGDINRDGVVDLQDLSVLLSYWFDTANFPDEADINSDGIINTFDFSEMLLILRSNGIIGSTQ